MFDIGASLRTAREKRGLTAEDVHRSLRIRERYLSRARGRALGAPTRRRVCEGFLRTYAEFLGLNGTLYIDELDARLSLRDAEPARRRRAS